MTVAHDHQQMLRIRERLASARQPGLRVALVLAHEILRQRTLTANSPEASTPPAPSPSGGAFSRDAYPALVKHVLSAVVGHVPAGASVLVVSKGDDALLSPSHDAVHFPRSAQGGYAGFYPRDGEAAIAHLQECVEAGARYFVLPATASWWLEYYVGLAEHLLSAGRVLHHDASCLIVELTIHPSQDTIE